MSMIWLAETAPAATEAAKSGNTNIALILALIAILPGLWATYVSYQQRKDKKAAENTTSGATMGVEFAKTAFEQMQQQVDRLTREQDKHDVDRAGWEKDREDWANDRVTWNADKANLLTQIAENTEQLHLMNTYMAVLVGIVDSHGLTRPVPPARLKLDLTLSTQQQDPNSGGVL